MKRRDLIKCAAALVPVALISASGSSPSAPRIPGVNYAKAGETEGWEEQEVVDLETGRVVDDVVKVDCVEGWAVTFIDSSAGATQKYKLNLCRTGLERQTIRGRFALRPVK